MSLPPTLFDEFSEFVSKNHKDKFEHILNRGYYNFIDKEAEATGFIVDTFIEFLKNKGISEVTTEHLWVFATWHSTIQFEINKNRTH
jgi:hypothetical protein